MSYHPTNCVCAECEDRRVRMTTTAASTCQPAPKPSDGQRIVDHPPHYNLGGFEVIDAIEAWKLGFHLGNVVKYVARADHKGAPIEDLRKAAWYLAREIERRERAR